MSSIDLLPKRPKYPRAFSKILSSSALWTAILTPSIKYQDSMIVEQCIHGALTLSDSWDELKFDESVAILFSICKVRADGKPFRIMLRHPYACDLGRHVCRRPPIFHVSPPK